MDQQSQILALREASSLINSGGDLQTVLGDLVLAACRHAKWTMGSIMSIDARHGHAYVIVRYDPTLLQRPLLDRWELATSPSIVALQRNEPVYIRDARVSEEFPGYRRDAQERDYRSVLVMPLDCADAEDRPMVLTVVAREITEVTPDQIDFLGMIVHLGKIAVEKQHRLLQEKLGAERLQRVLAAHTSLLQQALAEPAVATLADQVSTLLPNPILIIDFTTNLIVAGRTPSEAHFDDAGWQQAVRSRLQGQLLKAARAAAGQPPGQPQNLVLVDGRHRLALATTIEPLMVDDQLVGSLMIFQTPQQVSKLDQMLLDSAKFALSVQMMRSVIRFRFEERTLTDLFLEVVEGRWRDADDVVQRGQRLGLGLNSPQQMIIVAFPDTLINPSREAAGPHHALMRFLQQMAVPAPIVTVETGLVCLIPADYAADKTRMEQLLTRIAEETGRYFDEALIVILSGRCDALPDYQDAWTRSHRMIRIARSFGRSGALANHDFGPLPMLVAAADVADVRGFVEDSIGAMAQHDLAHGTPYIETLFAYLREGCRSQACADAMGLHVTTLRYRLARVTELFGIELATPEQRFAVELAIRLRGVIHAPGAGCKPG